MIVFLLESLQERIMVYFFLKLIYLHIQDIFISSNKSHISSNRYIRDTIYWIAYMCLTPNFSYSDNYLSI